MRRLWWLCAALALAACAPTRVVRESAPVDAQAGERLLSERESALFERTRFDLNGRIAISDGNDGGSGRFEWQQRGLATTLRFFAPVSARSNPASTDFTASCGVSKRKSGAAMSFGGSPSVSISWSR